MLKGGKIMNLSIIQKIKLRVGIEFIAKRNDNNRKTGYSLSRDLFKMELSDKRTELRQKVSNVIAPTYKLDAKLDKIKKALSNGELTETDLNNIKTYFNDVKEQTKDFETLEGEVKSLKEQQKNNGTAYNQEKPTQAQQQAKPTQAQQQEKPTQAQQGENTYAHKAYNAEELRAIFGDIADKINGGNSEVWQNKQTQSESQQSQAQAMESTQNDRAEESLTNDQKDFEKEVIKANKEIVKEAQEFLKSLDPNDPELSSKIENFMESHGLENGRGEISDLKEAISEAKHNIRGSQKALGYAYIHKQGENELSDSWHKMDSSGDVNPPKTFKNTKGQETTYQNFNESNSTAIINFEPPVSEVDLEDSKAGVGYNKQTGGKIYYGEVKKSPVNGVCVKISSNGLINFNLPENKEILSHPEVLSKLITMYPESFKTLPPAVYASDPKLFAESFKNGTIDKAHSNGIGKQSPEDYYFNAEFELGQMNERALSSSVDKSKMQEEALKKVSSQVQIDEPQMGGQ